MFNNNRIEVTHYGILSDKAHGDVRIAHLSDLHEKEFGIRNRRLFRTVDRLRPDIIAITGDLVAHERQNTLNKSYTSTFAKGLARIAPTYFVTGNHERAFDKEVVQILEDAGVIVVRKQMYSHNIRGTTVNISGVDDVSYKEADVLEMSNVFQDTEGYNIFLTHRPELYPELLDKNIDLILAGHTHAGQIRIPGISNLFMPGQGWFPKYVQGQFSDGATTMIISRGLGASGYPTFRVNNPPDLVSVTVAEMPEQELPDPAEQQSTGT